VTVEGPCYAAVQVTTGHDDVVKGACGRRTTDHTRRIDEIGCPSCVALFTNQEPAR